MLQRSARDILSFTHFSSEKRIESAARREEGNHPHSFLCTAGRNEGRVPARRRRLTTGYPPDEEGYVWMGTSCDQTRVIVNRARITIAQVNRNMPPMYAAIRESRFLISTILWNTTKISTNCPLISSEDPVAEKIGYYISTLIDDGACLQMGQGTVPNAILKFLEDKKDIGIHTEVFSDNLIPLIEKRRRQRRQEEHRHREDCGDFCAREQRTSISTWITIR